MAQPRGPRGFHLTPKRELILSAISALRAGLTPEEVIAQRPEAASVVRSPLVRALAESGAKLS